MSKFLGKRAKQEPYVYGEQPKDKKYIKINTNENPYGPSPKAMELLKNTNIFFFQVININVSKPREAREYKYVPYLFQPL